MNRDSQNAKGNIIVVDDTPANLHLLTGLLNKEGYEARPVPNGRLALMGAQAVPPDLILLDIKMPQMDGYEVCAQLKENETTREIPVIFLSALDAVGDKVKAFSCGGVDYITKPFHPEEVIARVRTHLELKFSKEQLQESYQVIKEQQDQMEEELEQARQMQKAILPDSLPQIPGAELTTKFVPVEHVGGDIYHVFEIGQGKYGLMIADVTGHGIPAALISFMVSGLFKDIPKNGQSTSETITLLNQALVEQIPESKFVTMFYGIYDSVEQTLLFSNAGHPPGLVIRQHSGDVFEHHNGGSILGIFSNKQRYFEETKFQLQPGDKLFLYTDALIDVLSLQSRIKGIPRSEQLAAYVKSQSHLPIGELMEQVFHYGLSHTEGNRFDDDCTMIGLEIMT
ncbi:MAG: SpoIIE family protein phosphatase [SAR324 cluster bacterium]|nr:SpoIIE family protein phosphatase [SAR324 cluster bacterium]